MLSCLGYFRMLFSGISGLIGCQNRVQNDWNCVGGT